MSPTVKLVQHFISKSYDLNALKSLHLLNHFNYRYTAFFIGCGQLILNLLVILVISIHKIEKKQRVQNQFVFAFILNLALADLVGFAASITDVIFDDWIFPKNYFVESPDLFVKRMTFGCIVQTSIMEFSYVQSLMSTAFLTLERYILIAKPFDYDKVGKLFFFLKKWTILFFLFQYINEVTTRVCIFLCWLTPAILAIHATQVHPDPINVCNPSHVIFSELPFTISSKYWRLRY